MSTSRETARDDLVALLTTALVGTGLPVKTVTGSKVEDLVGITPLVSVLSKGSDRPPATFKGNRSTFLLEIQVFVLQATSGWTNAQAEDAIDTIENIIAGVFEDNRTAERQFEYNGETTILEVAVASVPHYLEIIPTLVRLSKS
jgi:hypothetical protein